LNTDSEPEKDIGMMREQLATLEESLVSAELQNQELRERVALLEQQVIKAQRLVELESQELALAQEQAAQRQEEKLLLEQQLAEMQLTAADQPAQMAQQPTAPDQPDENRVDTAATEAQDTAATEDQEGVEAEATQPEGVQPAETGQPAVVPEPQPQTTAATETADEQQPAAPATQTNTREDTSSAVVPVAAPAPAKPWWQSAIDSVQGNSFSLVAGIAGVLVLLAGIILFVRRRRSIAEFEESILSGSGLQGQTDTTDTAANKNTDTSFLSDFGMAGMGSMQADEVDPLAEAEVYLAYGRDEQAEEVLKEAATRTPERHELKLKLLEIYQQRNDLNSFETLAEELYPAGGQGDTAVWSQVVQMGTKMNPDNPLFSQPVSKDGVAASAPPDIPFETADSDLLDALNGEAEKSVDPSQHPFPQPDEPVGIDEEFERLASQMGLSDDAAGTAAAAHLKGKDALPKEDPEMIDFASNERSELDFDIDLSGLEDQVDNKPADINKDEAALDDEELSSTDDAFSPDVHEIDLPEISDEPTLETNTLAGHEEDEGPGSAPAGKGSEIKVGDETLVRLDSAEPNGKAPGTVDEHRDETVKDVTRSFGVVTGDGSITSDGEDESDQWDEAATKLDLAQAYLNMGDKAGARSIIDEVMKEGSPSQRDQAAELQSQIG